MADAKLFTEAEFKQYIERATLIGAIDAARDIAIKLETAAAQAFHAEEDAAATTLREAGNQVRYTYLRLKEEALAKLQASQAASERKEGLLATTFDTNLAVETLD